MAPCAEHVTTWIPPKKKKLNKSKSAQPTLRNKFDRSKSWTKPSRKTKSTKTHIDRNLVKARVSILQTQMDQIKSRIKPNQTR